VIVLDASVVVDLLTRARAVNDVETVIQRAGVSLHAPDLLPIEVLQVLRRFEIRGALTPAQAAAAVRTLLDFPVRYHAAGPMTSAIWSLRHNLTAYDATYVALARALNATLLTRDQRLATAPDLGIPVIVA
jgi:predicted nucleic acid-binding protein